MLLKSTAAEAKVRDSFDLLGHRLDAKFSVMCVTEAELKAGKVGAAWWGNVLREGMQLKGKPRTPPNPSRSRRKVAAT